MIAGLLLAVGCAIAGSVAMLFKQRDAVASPVVLARHPVRSAIGLEPDQIARDLSRNARTRGL